MSHGALSDMNRFGIHPPWFLFAFESQLSLNTILDKVRASRPADAPEVNYMLDAVFALDRGWCINLGDGCGSFAIMGDDGNRLAGWVARESNNVLFDFLAWLSLVMPRFLRFQPILARYMLPLCR